MRDKSAIPPETAVARLAANQHGVVSHQHRSIGFSRQAVSRRVRVGRLHRVHRGVYAVGHARLTDEGRFKAAVLACGPGAVLSHRSAIVETDGYRYHRRQARRIAAGFEVLRFTWSQVVDEPQEVLDAVRARSTAPLPSPAATNRQLGSAPR